jgi:hypothetical protein
MSLSSQPSSSLSTWSEKIMIIERDNIFILYITLLLMYIIIYLFYTFSISNVQYSFAGLPQEGYHRICNLGVADMVFNFAVIFQIAWGTRTTSRYFAE